MRAKPLLSVFFVVLTVAISRADTIEATMGGPSTGTVMKYANGAFEVRNADGQTRSVSSIGVKRIVFDPRPVPAKVKARTKGALEGKVTVFENGAFLFEGAAGPEKLAAIFVDQIIFGGDRGNAIETITKGAQVDLPKKLVTGSVTIVDFYADWCGPCKELSPTLEQLAKTDGEVALRKIDIINWESPVARQYGVSSIPRVEIYDRKGKLVGTVRGVSPEEVRRYVAQAKTAN